MGSKCSCFAVSSTDEAEDALLGRGRGEEQEQQQQQQQQQGQSETPRGPPPPYQVNPLFCMLTEEQRLHIVSRLALIQSLPVGRYENKKSAEKRSDKSEKRECPICMNDFLPGETIRLLPCMHFYHIRCIDDWLMRAITCPTCIQRVDVVCQHSFYPQTHYNHRRNHSRGSVTSATGTVSPSATGSMEQLYPPQSPPPVPIQSPQQVIAEIH